MRHGLALFRAKLITRTVRAAWAHSRLVSEGFAERRAFCVRQIGSRQLRTVEIGTRQIRAAKRGFVERRVGEVRVRQTAAVRVDAGKVGIGEVARFAAARFTQL